MNLQFIRNVLLSLTIVQFFSYAICETNVTAINDGHYDTYTLVKDESKFLYLDLTPYRANSETNKTATENLISLRLISKASYFAKIVDVNGTDLTALAPLFPTLANETNVATDDLIDYTGGPKASQVGSSKYIQVSTTGLTCTTCYLLLTLKSTEADGSTVIVSIPNVLTPVGDLKDDFTSDSISLKKGEVVFKRVFFSQNYTASNYKLSFSSSLDQSLNLLINNKNEFPVNKKTDFQFGYGTNNYLIIDKSKVTKNVDLTLPTLEFLVYDNEAEANVTLSGKSVEYTVQKAGKVNIILNSTVSQINYTYIQIPVEQRDTVNKFSNFIIDFKKKSGTGEVWYKESSTKYNGDVEKEFADANVSGKKLEENKYVVNSCKL